MTARTSRRARSRNALEVYTLGLATVVGVVGLVADSRPGSLQALLPGWAQVVWNVALVLGGALALLGLGWQGRVVTGVVIEQTGLLLSGFSAGFYGVCVAINLGVATSSVALAYVGGFGLTCILRWVQLQRMLGALRYVQDHGLPLTRQDP